MTITNEIPPAGGVQLVRAIGRWSVVALTLNSILGSAIFGLPAVIAAGVGNAAPLAVLVSGLAMAVVIACYAEVSSQFSATGGSYLYARSAFGRMVGMQIGWTSIVTRLAAVAAALNLFVTYLAEFWPQATQPIARAAVITVFLGTLAIVNLRGVDGGARLSNITVVAKLLPIAVLCTAGLWYSLAHPRTWVGAPVGDGGAWLQAVLLMFFAYGGAESALNPMGEARNPRKDAAFGLLVALSTVIVLYTTLQFTVLHLLANPAHSERPLADAGRVLMGQTGAIVIVAAALISIYGFLTANMLTGPRLTYALAEQGDFPALFANLHPRFRTPYISIVAFALLSWTFALFGSFSWNVTLSAVGRLFSYAAVCIALPVLRRRQPDAAVFRLPGGGLLAPLGVVICLALVTRVDFSKSLLLGLTMLAALMNWLLLRGRDTSCRGAA